MHWAYFWLINMWKNPIEISQYCVRSVKKTSPKMILYSTIQFCHAKKNDCSRNGFNMYDFFIDFPKMFYTQNLRKIQNNRVVSIEWHEISLIVDWVFMRTYLPSKYFLCNKIETKLKSKSLISYSSFNFFDCLKTIQFLTV